MSVGTVTSESLKEKAKLVRQFLKEKDNVDVSHGHCIELVSKLFGFNDWNTASAGLKPDPKLLPLKIETVADMKTAMSFFKDSDRIDGMYEFNIKDWLSNLEPEEYIHAKDTCTQEFRFSLEQPRDSEFASFKLSLENEDQSMHF